MIATVTLNPAIDKSLTVPRFEVGKTNRGEVGRTDASGKGINVAMALKQFGADVCALGFMREATATSSSRRSRRAASRRTSSASRVKRAST